MAVDDNMASPYHRRGFLSTQSPRKSKRSKNVAFDVAPRQVQSDPVEGPSGSVIAVHLPAPASTAIPPIRSLRPSSSAGNPAKRPEDVRARPSDGILGARRLEYAEARVVSLEHALQVEKASQEQRQLKLRQDMMLGIVQQQDKVRKLIEEFTKAKRHRDKLAEKLLELQKHHKEHVDRLELQVTMEKSSTLRANSELIIWRSEAEHREMLHRTLEEDLDELRRIANEETAARRWSEKRQCLPPAYGSLDDVDAYPPPEECVDSGALEVATFKRTTRDKFTKGLTAAQAKHDFAVIKPETDSSVAAGEMYVSLCLALADAASNIDGVLVRAGDLFKANTDKPLPDGGAWLPGIERGHNELARMQKRSHARGAYVADRLAKLILELTARFLAALELRPVSARLSQTDKTRIGLSWTAIDSSLTDALRRTFDSASSAHPSRLMELQVFFTQVEMLQDRLNKTRVGSDAHLQTPYFDRAWSWLADCVEKERSLAAGANDRAERLCANAAIARIALEDDLDLRALVDADREGSVISSVPGDVVNEKEEDIE